MAEMVRFKIRRRQGPEAKPYWQEFDVPYRPGMNVIVALYDIQAAPRTASGAPTEPVAFECSCLEEVCGACSMLINGEARQACSALVDNLRQPIRLEPFGSFPVVRDLVVDRSLLFERMKRVKAWIPIDGTHAAGPGPRISQSDQQETYQLARCMSCGCCLEVCPQYGAGKPFVGAATINQVALMNSHPTGQLDAHERLEAVMGVGGVADCGNAQNCVHACPKEIPLTKAIAKVYRQTTLHWLKKLTQ